MSTQLVTATYRRADAEAPDHGSVVFTPQAWWVDATANVVIVAVPVERQLSAGFLSLGLWPTLRIVTDSYSDVYSDAYLGDTERIAPKYRVDESIEDVEERYYIDVPPGGTDLARAKPWQ